MSFGEGVVYSHRLLRGIPGSRKSLPRGNHTGISERTVAIGQADISQGVLGILCDGLLKVFNGLIDAFLSALFVKPEAALQIVLVGFGIRGIALSHALRVFAR